MAITSRTRRVTKHEIVEFSTRFTSGSSGGFLERPRPNSSAASVWMVCATAQDLASTTELHELWSDQTLCIERLIWKAAVLPGDEVRLRIEILEKRPLAAGLAGWVRWHWTLSTKEGTRALDLVASSLLEDRSASRNAPAALSPRVLYTIAEAAKLVGYSRYVLYDAIRNGELVAYRPNPRADLRVRADDIHEWVTRFPTHDN
jgi:excisionase family DNA binding protein